MNIWLNKKQLQIIFDALDYLHGTEYLFEYKGKERSDEEIEKAQDEYNELSQKIYHYLIKETKGKVRE